jgi:hypothetical protein
MPDWKTRLAVTYQEGEDTVLITPIDSFTPSFTLNSEALHSIEQTHVGVVYTPQAMSFSMTVRAIGDVAAKLTALALNGTRFTVTLQVESGSDWAFRSIVMSNCVITSASPSAVTPSGAPTATFSGFSLGAESKPSQGTPVSIP